MKTRSYYGIIKQQLARGVLEKVDNNVPLTPTCRVYYLPHHPVMTLGNTLKVSTLHD